MARRSPFLFVYGTLLQGLRDDVLKRVGAKLVGTGRIQGKLYDFGRYPGAKANIRRSDRVRGEVLRLPDPENALAILDEYEGVLPAAPAKSEFVRSAVRVVLDDGRQCQAWAYLYNRRVGEAKLIPSGDYRQRIISCQSGRKLRDSGDITTRGRVETQS